MADIDSWVKNQLDAGHESEEIRKSLLQEGYNSDFIDRILRKYQEGGGAASESYSKSKRWKILAAVFGILLTVLAIFSLGFFAGEEAKIKNTVKEFSTGLEKENYDQVAALSIGNLGREIERSKTYSKSFKDFNYKIRILHPEIVSKTEKKAVVECTAEITVVSTKNKTESETTKKRINVTLQKVEDEWKVIDSGGLLSYIMWNRVIQVTENLAESMETMESVQSSLAKGWECLTHPEICTTSEYEVWMPHTEVSGTVSVLTIEKLSAYRESGNLKVAGNVRNRGSSPMKKITLGLKVKKGEEEKNCNEHGGEFIRKLEPNEEEKISWNCGNKEFNKQTQYRINVNYTYSANASVRVRVLKDSYYEKLGREGNLNFKNFTTRYSDGPAAVGIGIGRQQPMKGGQNTPLIFSLVNAAEGNILEIKSAEVILPKGLTSKSRGGNYRLNMKEEIMGEESYSGTDILKIISPEKRSRTFKVAAEIKYRFFETRTGRLV